MCLSIEMPSRWGDKAKSFLLTISALHLAAMAMPRLCAVLMISLGATK